MQRDQLLSILSDAFEIYNRILQGQVRWEGRPVRAKLGTWSEETDGFCMVCLAGAYHYKKSGKFIHQEMKALREKGMLGSDAMSFVIKDAEIILDSIRYPLWFSHRMPKTVCDQRTDVFLRERITLPTDHYQENLTPEQVVDRLRMILALNTDTLERVGQKDSSRETVSLREHL